ncbi:RbsD/FucU family protein [Micrococcus luteus]|nr:MULTISPECIES: RbsD/FucU family protein [Micrococcus]MCT1760076.1 RbsD/FucU family protein [Micrococcus luteus]MCV7523998.1 RbsD/FucU family protein [Micrococcus luteus]MCV7697697.1 RbsD/FucU family protein [Micrococcus luteus]MCV7712547.1 RbsD/FucU family protein [Micrococcus luteus]MCV7714763.1 RbsD/FucU family protein [Micrococcus luteus]
MIRGGLLHPELLSALAAAGHGTKVLIADALFPQDTAVRPGARRVFLNLTPGTVSAREILRAVAVTVDLEAAVSMSDADGGDSPSVLEMREDLADYRHGGGQEVALSSMERFAFYEATAAEDVSMVVVSGETRPYSNLLLTIGVP